jgi:hypothetical protein
MTFEATLNAHFPGALPEADFIERSHRALLPLGFTGPSSIACVGVCRDELTQSLIKTVSDTWGEPFSFSGLAGMLFLGKTGFSAAYQHAPLEGGRERYVHFVLPHIGIGRNGEVGQCFRSGRTEPSSACGALLAFQSELASGRLDLRLDPYDVEQSLLKHRLLRRVRYGDVPDLVSLTRITYEVLVADLEEMIAQVVDTGRSDYAVLSGIQIHGPDNRDFVWPGVLYAVVNGKKQELTLT